MASIPLSAASKMAGYQSTKHNAVCDVRDGPNTTINGMPELPKQAAFRGLTPRSGSFTTHPRFDRYASMDAVSVDVDGNNNRYWLFEQQRHFTHGVVLTGFKG